MSARNDTKMASLKPRPLHGGKMRSILSDAERPKDIGVALYEVSREEPTDLVVSPRDDKAWL